MDRLSCRALWRALLLGCALLAAGCSTSSESPTIGTISTAGLAGVWRLELLQLAGESAELAPSGATYTITLSNGSISARRDCNTCSGTFTLVGDSLSIPSGLTCTPAVCLAPGFAARFTRILDGESTVGIDGSTMVLVSTRGMLRFTR